MSVGIRFIKPVNLVITDVKTINGKMQAVTSQHTIKIGKNFNATHIESNGETSTIQFAPNSLLCGIAYNVPNDSFHTFTRDIHNTPTPPCCGN